jgi:hypothetical protein
LRAAIAARVQVSSRKSGASRFYGYAPLDEAEEEALRAGGCGEAAQWAIEHQIKVGDYLGARDFVPVTQARIMADTESLGEAGVEWLERLARLPAQARRSPRARRATATTSRNADGRRLSSTSASRRASSTNGVRSAAPRASGRRDSSPKGYDHARSAFTAPEHKIRLLRAIDTSAPSRSAILDFAARR